MGTDRLYQQLQTVQERAEELAKVNQVLQRSLTSLTTTEDLQSFLLTVMQEAAYASGAVTAGVFVHNPSDDTLHLFKAIVLNEIIDILHDPQIDLWRLVPANSLSIWEQVRGGHIFWHTVQNSPSDITDAMLRWHEERGHKVLAWIPMMLQQQALGFFGLAFADEQPATESKLEQCRFLAQQAALALQITRLSEAAKQTAVAREREQAAQDRAAELASVNAALQRSLTTLTNANSLQSFLQVVLQQVIQASGAIDAAVFVHDAVSNTLPMTELVLGGEVINVQTDPRAEVWRTVPAFSYDYWTLMVQEEQILWYDLETLPFAVSDAILTWHRQLGHDVLVWIPMFLQHQALGFLGLAFDRQTRPTENKLEQCRILAQHAALALQISRLSEEAKQTAVAREREQAAQERVIELANVNAALQRSLTTLTTATSLQSFLRTVLQQMVYASGAITSAVFVHDAATNTLPLAEIVLRGEILDVETDPRLQVWRTAPSFSYDFWTQILKQDQLLWHDLNNPPFHIEEVVLDWHQQMGHEVLVWIPMFLQNQALGFLGLAFSRATQPTENKLEQCRILAQHAALALQTSRLSEEAKQTAIVREREQAAQERAAELAKTNTVLQRSLSSLTNTENLRTFLRASLHEISLATGSVGTAAFVYNAAHNTLHITEVIFRGQEIEVETDPRFELWRTVPADISDLWRQMSENHKIYWFDNDAPPPEEWTFANEWHRQMGHRTLATIPLKVGNQVLGFLGLAFADVHQPTEIELERAYALAQQAALALQISRLSEEAKQVAIAREREQAAQERASELAKTNAALQRSLSSLTTVQDLQIFLQAVLKEVVLTTGSVTAAVFIYSPASNVLHLTEAILWGEVIAVATDPRFDIWRTVPADISDLWRQMSQNEKIFWFEIEGAPQEHWSFADDWHHQMGHRMLATIPLKVEKHVLGFLGLAFADLCQPTQIKLEQANALAQQIALALQISRLSEEAQQVAIAREQERAAQERAVELAKTNEALRQSLTTLTSTNSLRSFLRVVLQQAIYVSGATDAAVFVHDAASNTIPMVELILREECVDVETDPRAEVWRTSSTFSHEYWTLLMQEEQILCHNLEDLPFEISDSILAWHHQLGHEVLAWIPMLLQHQPLGFIGLAFTHNTHPIDSQLEQSRILAQHAALALQISRLSEKAQQVAIAREQERLAQERAAELARTNQSLQRSIDRLANEPDASVFLCSLLQEAIYLVNGLDAQIFLYDPASHTLRPDIGVDAQGIRLPPHGIIPDNYIFSQPIPADITPVWNRMLALRRPIHFTADDPDQWPGSADFHRSRRCNGALCAPMLLGDKPLGFIGLTAADRATFTPTEIAFFHTITQKATLAIQMARLHEEVQQTAIAREREQAAQERAEELAKTNAAMQRSLSSLADSETLQSFLPAAVREAIEISGAVSAAVFIYNAKTHSFSLAEMLLWGEVVDINTDPRATFWQTIPPRTHAAWKKAAEIGKVHWYQNTEPPPDWDHETQWHYELGHQGLGAIPMLVAGQVVGTLGLAFAEPGQPEGRLEQCQFIVNQIALALYLSRLSEEARQVAIVREREQVAQEQAEELARANAAMQRSLAILVRSKSLEAFLPTVLQEAIDISGAITAAVFVYQPASETFTLIAQYVLGRMRDLKTDPEAHYWSNIPAQTQAVWKQMAQAESIHWYDNSNPPADWDYEVEWNQRKGHHGIAGIPMLVDGQIIGLLRLAFVEAEQPEGKLEQCQFLAHQIALALCLSQLSEEAQQVAVARTEEKAAQERATELTTINAALTQRDRLLSVIAQITQELLENPNLESAIAQAIQIMGHAVGVSSINLLQQKEDTDTGRLYHHMVIEWAAPHIARQTDELSTSIVNNDDIAPLVVRLHAGETMHLHLEDYPEFLRTHLERFGLKTSCVAPIFVEDCYFGCLCFDDYVDRRLWTAQEIEVLSAGAGVIGTALLRQRLVDRAMQTQAERERAAELAKANAAMNRILTLTTRDPGLDALLTSVLAAITEQFDTPLAEWWEEIDATTFAKRLSYLNGRLLSPEEMQGHHGVPYFKLPPTMGTIEEVLGEIHLCEDIEQLPWDDVEMEKIRAWYGAQGFSKFLSIQIKVDNRSVGGMFVFLPADRSFTDTQIQFATGMAQHLALAILIANRAEEAKQAVIAREREQAAQAQAAELAEINEALTQRDRLLSTLAQVTQDLLENPNVEQGINQSLQKLGQAAGADRLNLLAERLDPDTGRLKHHVILEWSAPGIPRQIDNPYTSILDNDVIPGVFADLHQGRSLALYLEDYPESIRPHLRRIAIQASGIMPIFVGDTYFGCLCFDNCLKRRLWLDHEIDVLTAAAGAIGSALLRRKLAEQLMQARAEEERADELAKANAAMNRILTLTARETGIDALLSSVLAAITEQFDTPLAEWWEELDTTTVSKRLTYLNGRLLTAEEMQGHHGVPYFKLPAEVGTVDDVLAELYLCEDIEQLPWNDVEIEKIRAWYGAQGLSKFFNVRVKVDGRGVGSLVVFLLADRTFTDTQIQFASGMAQHLALAIMISKRAEAAQQAVIAYEREQAAQERATQLEQTTQSLQRTIAYLNENPTLQAFLYAVLQEALTVSGAVTSAVFTYDAPSHTLQLIACMLHSEVVDIATDPRMEIWRAPVPADVTSAWEIIRREDLWVDTDFPSPEHWPISIPWHRQFGHKIIAYLLLSAGDEPLGFLGLAFANAVPPEEMKLAQCRTLAQQVSLALRLESLSQQATQSALLEERNRMAGEIHDTLAQSFTGINFQINLAKRIAHHDPEEAQRIYDRIAHLAQSGLAEARRSVWSLYSANETYTGLEQDLRRCVETIAGASSTMHVEMKTSGSPYDLTETIGKNLLKIGQEAITNIFKHAQATSIEIEVIYQEHQICLLVKDNGQGFSVQDNRNGFGLLGMAERIERMNGQLTVTSSENQGTRVFVQVPLRDQP